MYIERILCPIVALGPGKRLVIWTKGCSKNCDGCISPEMAVIGNARAVSIQDICVIVSNIYSSEGFDGITISGGDPMEQLPELIELLENLRKYTDDILVYTGYVWPVFSQKLEKSEIIKIKSLISVLIDGPYIHEQNISQLSLRGSLNQNIIFFDESQREKYEEYMSEGRKLQNIYLDDKLLMVGIMDK